MRHYLAVMRRQVLLIAVIAIVLGAAGYAYSAAKTPYYEATAQLLYVPQLDITNPLNQGFIDPTAQELQLQSAVTTITAPAIHHAVATQIGDPGSVPGHSVSAAITTSDPLSSSPVDNGVAVTVVSTDPRWSAKLANTYAQAFVDWSVANDRTRLTAAETVISAKLKQLKATGQQGTSDFTMLTNDQQELEILSAASTGNFSLAVPATPPSTPSDPKPKRTAAMAVVLGLFFGIGFAFLREKLDTRLHNHREVGEIVGLPVIGRVAKIPEEALARGSLVVASETEGRAAESIRVLRSNLQFASLGEKNQVLVVMSAQKGEGKSLLTCNLAASLALAGKKVMLIDADLRRPRVHSIFGIHNTRGVSSVIAGFCSLEDALQTYNFESPRAVTIRVNGDKPPAVDADAPPRLTLLAAGPQPPNPGEMVASRQFATMISELSTRKFDYILIDSPAFLAVGDAAAVAAVADAIVLLVNLKMTNRPTLEEAHDFLRSLPPNKLGVVTVMDSVGKNERYHYYAQNA